jgi:hypothetical protein
MITLAIFVGLAAVMLSLVTWVVRMWSQSERRRVLYERAGGAMERIADDLRLAIGREPAGVDLVRVRFIGDLDPRSGRQRLMFVRSFESGPERAITFAAGDGQPNNLKFRPEEDEDGLTKAIKATRASGSLDGDSYTGKRVGDFRALGGMAQVAYFEQNRTLYRAIRAPAEGPFLKMLNPKAATPVITDCLYLRFDYWSQYTATWHEMPGKSKTRGPEKIWDSTRGINDQLMMKFILHRGPESLNDPTDDVFPQKVRITLTVDSPMPRCVNTKLTDDLGPDDGMIYVDSTRGFRKGGTDQSYILIGKEWIHYKDKTRHSFIADVRGARGTNRLDHGEDDVVRTGRTFRRIVFIPGHREDWTPNEVYFQRLRNIQEARTNK